MLRLFFISLVALPLVAFAIMDDVLHDFSHTPKQCHVTDSQEQKQHCRWYR
jgi:hypothetical protein